jgi:hypothetical protein
MGRHVSNDGHSPPPFVPKSAAEGKLSTRTPREIDTRDQFIDTASQWLAQRQFTLEPG